MSKKSRGVEESKNNQGSVAARFSLRGFGLGSLLIQRPARSSEVGIEYRNDRCDRNGAGQPDGAVAHHSVAPITSPSIVCACTIGSRCSTTPFTTKGPFQADDPITINAAHDGGGIVGEHEGELRMENGELGTALLHEWRIALSFVMTCAGRLENSMTPLNRACAYHQFPILNSQLRTSRPTVVRRDPCGRLVKSSNVAISRNPAFRMIPAEARFSS